MFAGTCVPVETLFDYLEAGDTLDAFLEQFPTVLREQAIAVLEAAKRRVAERVPAYRSCSTRCCRQGSPLSCQAWM